LLYDEALASLFDARRGRLTPHASIETEAARALVREARANDPLGVKVPSADVLQACIWLIRLGASARKP
jgi:hypothetical protein